MKLIVHHPSDAIKYIAPLIISTCRDMATDIMPHDGQTELVCEVNFNLTTFSYTVNKIDPHPLITIMVDDSYNNPQVIVGVPFISDEIFFKFIFKRIGEDWTFVMKYCTDKFGHNEVDRTSMTIPVFDYNNNASAVQLIRLRDGLVRIINGTRINSMTIDCDCVDSEESFITHVREQFESIMDEN